MMRRKGSCLLFFVFALIVPEATYVAAGAGPAILPTSDLSQYQQFQTRSPLDVRPRLSVQQQAQILSDVQQHQHRYLLPGQEEVNQRHGSQGTGNFPSLAKYKVDRTKQQLQEIQQQIKQQQQKIAQQLGQSYVHQQQQQQHQSQLQQQQQQQQSSQYQQQFGPGSSPNFIQDLSSQQPLFTDQETLQTYLEKQRQLAQLQKQREQLILEQQELRRQQELLRLQQLAAATSTTTTTTTTTTPKPSTTPSSVLLSSPTSRRITPAEADLFLRAIASHQKKISSSTTSIPSTPTTTTTFRSISTTPTPTTSKSRYERFENADEIPENILSLIQQSHGDKVKGKIRVIYQTEKPSTTRQSSVGKSSESSDKDTLLKQLKAALAQSSDEENLTRNVTTRDLILPNGKKVQVIQSPDLASILPSSTGTTTTIKPPKLILEELTKGGVLPPNADFEVIRQKADGKLEEVGKVPIQNIPGKKVTFVVLEEQSDGSYKVQGVKGNSEKDQGTDVQSIVERIKKGELKLPPPSTSNRNLDKEDSHFLPTSQSSAVSTSQSVKSVSSSFRPTTVAPNTYSGTPRYVEKSSTTTSYSPYVTVSPNSLSPNDKYVTSASTVSGHVVNSLSATSPKSTQTTRSQFIPTMAPVKEIVTSISSGSSSTNPPTSHTRYVTPGTSPTPRSILGSSTTRDNLLFQENFSTISPIFDGSSATKPPESLATLLRREGLFAMAKYLRQSGLDTVLNETGPYTIFVPTDKAFRTLLVQLGGPERAEQKFRENPRLLSGLLLHHVIPGAFRIDSLQDEMTGVSLAGTQLRVNEYAMHDHEWNDIKVTTINGARVAPNKRDIEIPQGIAHAVDRVMFPLPVGDLIQTLQADRERRFSNFLKLLHASGLESTLTGSKTLTVFAPIDAAFAAAVTKNGAPVWTEEDGPEAAKAIVSKHIIPTTLYTSGMRYYHQKDTLRAQVPIHIQKNGGRIKVNDVASVVTHNVPATNGVLHAIDTVL